MAKIERKGVFETNSSSTHVLTLKRGDEGCLKPRAVFGDSDFNKPEYFVDIDSVFEKKIVDRLNESYCDWFDFSSLVEEINWVGDKIGLKIALLLVLCGVSKLEIDRFGAVKNFEMKTRMENLDEYVLSFVRGYISFLVDVIKVPCKDVRGLFPRFYQPVIPEDSLCYYTSCFFLSEFTTKTGLVVGEKEERKYLDFTDFKNGLSSILLNAGFVSLVADDVDLYTTVLEEGRLGVPGQVCLEYFY